MTVAKINAYTPALVSSIVLGILTLLVVFNADKWSFFVPIFVIFGFVGLSISGKQEKANDRVSRARWQSAAISLLVGTVIYIVVGLITALGQSTEEQRLGLVLMAFVIIPFYFGVAQLLSILLIRQE